jgi:hypothetical protein
VIQSAALLKDLKAQLKLVQVDLRARADDTSDRWGARLHEEYAEARKRERTGFAWVAWRDNEVDQASVAWLISMTFVRFCEDNGLLSGARINGQPVPVGWIAGPGDGTQRAEENLTAYFRENPTHNRRDWLRQAFIVLAAQPAGKALVDQDHNPVWIADISAERASALIDFWRETDATGVLVHDFTDPDLDTRFLGDLYQDLSDHARKTYALLQTPIFVEEFILDQTLTQALAEFGLDGLKLIDPTCGSGHFLLGAFERLVQQWQADGPALDPKERVRRAMDSIHGVDLNPFAVAIARFRLTVAGLLAMGERSLVGVPNLGFHLAIGDSLLGEFGGAPQALQFEGEEAETYLYETEDLKEYVGILQPSQYHVVVGNPPYITVKDKALNTLYRRSYPTAARKYALSAPFAELFFRLAIRGVQGQSAGYVGQITSNSFMTREFGKKMVEDFLSGNDLGNPVDLTYVIDSAGAWMAGHNFDGTPTVILVGRRRRPVERTIRAVLGIKGDASQPAEPAKGPVWREIVDHIDEAGFEGAYVSVTDLDREVLKTHPWSLSGGGATSVMESINGASRDLLGSKVGRIGFFGVTGSDDAFQVTPSTPARIGAAEAFREQVVGDEVRDFAVRAGDFVFFPYGVSHELLSLQTYPAAARLFWPLRTVLGNRATFSKRTYFAEGRPWYEWHQLPKDDSFHAWAISFAFVATHNHFVLVRDSKVFGRSAPIIKLPAEAVEDDHVGLTGVLNSSTACFWLKDVSYPKDKNAEPWATRYEFTGTKLEQFPLPARLPLERARSLDSLAQMLAGSSPRVVIASWLEHGTDDLAERIKEAEDLANQTRRRLIFEQEELDWEVYRLYGLIDEDLTYQGSEATAIELGQRPFEIALARAIRAGEKETEWFERHSSVSTADIPRDLPATYQLITQRRLDEIEVNASIRLLESPEFKRRWATTPWLAELQTALEATVLDRLEAPTLWRDGQGPLARSVAEISDALRGDAVVRELVAALTGDTDADLSKVLSSLVMQDAAPYLAAHRYKPSGLEKFRTWQQIWNMQRREDAGEKVNIPVPPKYNDKDFISTASWQVRGRLDVPKERFILYPGLRREGDSTVVLGWAGWDHRDQALALARELPAQEALGADDDLLTQMVAGLVELEPWVQQWHSDVDPSFGVSPAQVVTGVIDQHLSRLESTRERVTAWTPPAATRGRRPRNS